jgi:hypothetical protein
MDTAQELSRLAVEAQQQELAVRVELARRHFRHFLPYVRIPAAGIGMVPLEMWPYIAELCEVLAQHRKIVVAKPRKIGMTTFFRGHALHHAMYTPYARVLVTNKRQDDANDFIDGVRHTYYALPPILQTPIDSSKQNNQSKITFTNNSTIEAMPSTEDAGRGPEPTLILMDEADFHQYLEQALHAMEPAISDNRGQLVMFSTVQPYQLNTPFQTRYLGAPENGWVKRFYPWDIRPGRNQQWYEDEKQGWVDQAAFEKEFPASEEEAFAPASAIAAFDQKALLAMQQDCREPVEIYHCENGVEAWIWQQPQADKRYTAGTDTAHGIGQDRSVTVVLDTNTGTIAARISSAHVGPDDLGIASVELLNRYDQPIWGIEDAGWGERVIKVAQDLRYRRIYHYDEGKPGWHTWDTAGGSHREGSRSYMMGDLMNAIRHRNIQVYDKEGLQDFFNCIHTPPWGKVEAIQGTHDDFVMATGIAWALRGYARPMAGDRGIPDARRRDRLGPSIARRRGWHSW